jgi:hypothetical protein
MEELMNDEDWFLKTLGEFIDWAIPEKNGFVEVISDCKENVALLKIAFQEEFGIVNYSGVGGHFYEELKSILNDPDDIMLSESFPLWSLPFLQDWISQASLIGVDIHEWAYVIMLNCKCDVKFVQYLSKLGEAYNELAVILNYLNANIEEIGWAYVAMPATDFPYYQRAILMTNAHYHNQCKRCSWIVKRRV